MYNLGCFSWWLWRVREPPYHFPGHTEEFLIWYLFLKSSIYVSTPTFIFCRFGSFKQETVKKLEEIKCTHTRTPHRKTKSELEKERHKQEDEAQKNAYYLKPNYTLFLLLRLAFAWYRLAMEMWHGTPAEGKWWVEYMHGMSEFSNCAPGILQDLWVGCMKKGERRTESCPAHASNWTCLWFYIWGFLKKKKSA